MFARQRHGIEAALDQAGVEVADIVARRTEQHRRRCLVEAQQVDDGILDIGGRHGDGLIGDVAMATVFAHRRDAQRVALVALGQRHDRLGDGCRKHEGAPCFGCRIKDLLKVLAEPHVEHFIGFIEDGDLDAAQLQRAAFKVIAQPPRRADDDMRALAEQLAFLGSIHAADTGGDARAGLAIQPDQFATDLQRQFAGRRDDQRQRRTGAVGAAFVIEQLGRHGDTEGDGLARSGLRRDQQVTRLGFGLEDGGLDRGGRGIATGGKRFGEKRRQSFKGHAPPCPSLPQNAMFMLRMRNSASGTPPHRRRSTALLARIRAPSRGPL